MLRTHEGGQIAHRRHVFAHHTVALKPHLEILLQGHGDLQRVERIQADGAAVAEQNRIVGKIGQGDFVGFARFPKSAFSIRFPALQAPA